MPKSLLDLKTSIRADIWASSEAENLVEAHNNAFLEALSQIQKSVPCYRNNQANVIAFCNTFFKCVGGPACGMTVVKAPSGVIDSVYTISDGDWCTPVYYRQGNIQDVECYQDPCRSCDGDEISETPVLPMGFKKADAARDADDRADCGVWAIHKGNLYIAPFIRSDESVVIEWTGEKTASEWSDEDPLVDEIDLRKAVKLYVQYAHERDYGDPAREQRFHNRNNTGSFDEALSDLMLRCREETRLREDQPARFSRPCYTSVFASSTSTSSRIKVGSFDLDADSAELPLVTVDLTSHNLQSVPSRIDVGVLVPDEASDIFTCVLIDGFTATQFKVRLTGLPTTAGYKLTYTLFP